MMKKQTVFESYMNTRCILTHVESAFGIESRNVAEIHLKSWGMMLHIISGKYQGWYDVHTGEEETNCYFITLA